MRTIVLFLAWISTGFAAQDAQTRFNELATAGTSSVRRDALVTELSACTFSEVGTQVAQTICGDHSRIRNASTSKPWLEEDCPEPDRIRYAAYAIWRSVVENAEAGSLSEALSKLCLEDRPKDERMLYLDALRYRHYDQRAKDALEHLANDKAQPPEIEIKAAEILVQKADPDAYMFLLIEACDQIKDSSSRSQQFEFATQGLTWRVTAKTKASILNYGFTLLSKLDDGKSGKGYQLATHLGEIVGIAPIRNEGPFSPDWHLPQYQGEHGFKDSFFQDTVNNAQQWWREHKKDYVQKG